MHRVVTNNKTEKKKGSVLVADQNDALTELISELLRDEGYKSRWLLGTLIRP